VSLSKKSTNRSNAVASTASRDDVVVCPDRLELQQQQQLELTPAD
jgi:hypothetical protein